MKKIVMLFAAAALVLGAASCQKENFQKALAEGQEKIDYSDDPMGVIKVYIDNDDTKMSYTENDKKLQRSWAVDDILNGCTKVEDGTYKSFAYKITGFGEDTKGKYAILEKEPGADGVPSANAGTRIHFVYAPGAVKFNTDGSCLLDLSKQEAGHIPDVMVASGSVGADEEGNPKLNLSFKSVAAVLAIKSPSLKDFDDNAMTGTFSKVSVSALTRGKMALGTSGYSEVTDTEAGIATVTANENFGTDVYVAVLPGNYTDITAKVVDAMKEETRLGSFKYTASPSEPIVANANAYLRINGKDFTRIPVATIGTNKYATVDAAVDDANKATEDVTIKMLEDDATIIESLAINNTSNNKIIIDLSGKKIGAKFVVTTNFEIADETGEGVIEADKNTIKMGQDGEFGVDATFILNGGTIKTLNGNYAISADGIKNGDQPTVLIKKGNIIGTGGNAVRIKYTTATFGENAGGDIYLESDGSNAIWTSSGSKVTIIKGEYIAKGTGNLYYFGDNSCNVEFKGGTYTSESSLFSYYNSKSGLVNPTVTIEDGKYFWDGDKNPFHDGITKVNILGGYYNNSVAGYEAPGYICVESSEIPEYSYKVIVNEDKSKIQVGDKKFETVQSAIEEANKATAATTIKMLQDVEILDAIQFTTDAPLTLDLNGHSITASNTTTANPAILMNTENVNLTIVDYSQEADGRLDQKYNGEAYTVIVNTGTLNVKGGTICNTSSNGYGRWAMQIAGTEGKAAATVNIDGGYIWGGRALSIGSGIEGIVPKINITDGIIEGVHTSDTYSYGTITFTKEYYNCTFTGGVLISNAGPCFYTARTANSSTFTIGDENDDTTIPYLWTKSSTWCFRSGSSSASSRLFVYNAYCNKHEDKNSVFKATNATAKNMIIPVQDSDNRKYTIHVDCDDNTIAIVGEESFDDISDAIASVNDSPTNVTLTFIRDEIKLESNLEITNTQAEVTIDLNGCKVFAPNNGNTYALKLATEGVKVNLIDNKGTGRFDHLYDGAANTVCVDAGTLNVVSANVSNTTSPGYGRVGILVSGKNGETHVNVKGGKVLGGRAILVGSGIAGKVPELVVSGGVVEGTYENADKDSNYPAIGMANAYGKILICGGLVKAYQSKSVIYTNKLDGVEIVVRKGDDGAIPCIYNTDGSNSFGNATGCSGAYKVYECYSNVKTVSSSSCFSPYSTRNEISPIKIDGLTYKWYFQPIN